MSTRINWQSPALQDLAAVSLYIGSDNESAALGVATAIVELVNSQLPLFPRSGRVGRVAGTRELVVSKTPYIVVYEIVDEQVNILSILHTSQSWPEWF